MASEAEVAAMRRAIALAEHGLGRAYPNPIVGAVVLDASGAVAGEGWHHGIGTPHAERHALAAAGERARGGTVVSTLEPCGHQGRTGPCAHAIVEAGVRRAVWAVGDPLEAHRGEPYLREHGVDVEAGLLAGDAAESNRAWLYAGSHDRPYVTWKYAASLDGRVAAADGSSKWVTGEAARADVHRLRGTCDAIAAGISTVLADDPALTVRAADGSLVAGRPPLRVVVDSTARVPLDARVLDDVAPTLVATTAAAPEERLAALREAKADVVVLPASAHGHTDVRALLRHLRRERAIVHLLVEGGPKLAGTLADERLVDEIVGYVAPCVLGARGRPLLDNAGAESISAAWRLSLHDVTRFGDDTRLVFRAGER